jgi:hypothetical protein
MTEQQYIALMAAIGAICTKLDRLIENTRLKPRKKRDKPFTPPTEGEVAQYAESIGFKLDAEQFVNFYTAKGWKVGRSKMQDWQAAVRTWKQRATEKKKRLLALPGKSCSSRGCRMPAVYKDTSGDYDHFYCADHMPDEVKKRFE